MDSTKEITAALSADKRTGNTFSELYPEGDQTWSSVWGATITHLTQYQKLLPKADRPRFLTVDQAVTECIKMQILQISLLKREMMDLLNRLVATYFPKISALSPQNLQDFREYFQNPLTDALSDEALMVAHTPAVARDAVIKHYGYHGSEVSTRICDIEYHDGSTSTASTHSENSEDGSDTEGDDAASQITILSHAFLFENLPDKVCSHCVAPTAPPHNLITQLQHKEKQLGEACLALATQRVWKQTPDIREHTLSLADYAALITAQTPLKLKEVEHTFKETFGKEDLTASYVRKADIMMLATCHEETFKNKKSFKPACQAWVKNTFAVDFKQLERCKALADSTGITPECLQMLVNEGIMDAHLLTHSDNRSLILVLRSCEWWQLPTLKEALTQLSTRLSQAGTPQRAASVEIGEAQRRASAPPAAKKESRSALPRLCFNTLSGTDTTAPEAPRNHAPS